MTELKCSVEGCTQVFQTEELVSPLATFICKHHPRSVQMATQGRVYNPSVDSKDEEIHFQDHSFDKTLHSGAYSPKPESIRLEEEIISAGFHIEDEDSSIDVD